MKIIESLHILLEVSLKNLKIYGGVKRRHGGGGKKKI